MKNEAWAVIIIIAVILVFFGGEFKIGREAKPSNEVELQWQITPTFVEGKSSTVQIKAINLVGRDIAEFRVQCGVYKKEVNQMQAIYGEKVDNCVPEEENVATVKTSLLSGKSKELRLVIQDPGSAGKDYQLECYTFRKCAFEIPPSDWNTKVNPLDEVAEHITSDVEIQKEGIITEEKEEEKAKIDTEAWIEKNRKALIIAALIIAGLFILYLLISEKKPRVM